VNGFSIIYQQFIALYVRFAVTGPDSSQVLFNVPAHLIKYHTTDKHDAPPSHIKLTLGQPAPF